VESNVFEEESLGERGPDGGEEGFMDEESFESVAGCWVAELNEESGEISGRCLSVYSIIVLA
jgi:hypothetical protein